MEDFKDRGDLKNQLHEYLFNDFNEDGANPLVFLGDRYDDIYIPEKEIQELENRIMNIVNDIPEVMTIDNLLIHLGTISRIYKKDNRYYSEVGVTIVVNGGSIELDEKIYWKER